MYRHILLALDNSEWARYCASQALDLAKRTRCQEVVGLHVYAAKLHDKAFQRMEAGLPAQYQKPEELAKQRRIHDGLISHGLELISRSYLDDFLAQAARLGARATGKVMEGKHFKVIAEEVNANGYDLLVLGAHGLGHVDGLPVGSVCERVVRWVNKDVLVVREEKGVDAGTILVGIDGSTYAFAALEKALFLAKVYGSPVEAVYVFDPFFHNLAFNRLARVLSPEAASVFRFREQQKLHDEIINQGLAKVGEMYLERARAMAEERGLKLRTTILQGKICTAFLAHAAAVKPALIVVGRYGLHFVPGAEIGSNAENIYRLAPANVLICAGGENAHVDSSGEDNRFAQAQEVGA